ncbi:hypothetical protein Tco_0757730 [Tanacetum coccineum]
MKPSTKHEKFQELLRQSPHHEALRIEPRVSMNAPLSTSTPSNSFEFQQLAASLEDKMDIRMSHFEKIAISGKQSTMLTSKR